MAATAPPSPSPTGTTETAEEQRVTEAVIRTYRYISDGNYDALWETETSAFQERCSFDDMVSYIEDFRRTSGWDELVPAEVKVEISNGQAVADYIVEVRADGDLIETYGYSVMYFNEDGEWRAEETCYPAAEG